MNAPGSSILKIASILFIIFGAIAALFSLLALLGSTALTSIIGGYSTTAAVATGGILMFASIIALAASALEVFIGVIGLKKCNDPSQANFFIVTGAVLCGLTLITMIMSFSFLNLISFVLPVLYIVGGTMNNKG